jgi:acyl-coenzyme A thioesterase PaaI-like protein
MDERERQARYCFGCGSLNPQGLHLDFQVEEGRVTATFTPEKEHQGFPGQMHGGLVVTLLDEAMGWCTLGQKIWGVTAKMNVRFREPVPLYQPVTVSSAVEKDRRRWVVVRAEIRSAEGDILAEADGIFMRVSGERQRQFEEIYLPVFSPDGRFEP